MFGKFVKAKACFFIYLVVCLMFSVYLINPVNAQENSEKEMACCEVTKSGETCRYTLASECDSSNGNKVGMYRTCDMAKFCQPGCCVSPEGTCSKMVGKATCESLGTGWTWYNNKDCSLDVCNKGCCVLAETECFFTTERNCAVKTAQFAGLEKDFRATDSETECLNICKQADKGCCVKNDGSCVFTSRSSCGLADGVSGGTGFYKDVFCSNVNLKCMPKCEPHFKKGCVENEEDVYWFDSCGNIEDKAEDCNYDKGTICSEADKEHKEAYCKDVNCKDVYHDPSKKGYFMNDPKYYSYRKNGESWCWYDTLPGLDAVGSRHYRHICINGEEVVEPCKDFREEFCRQTEVGGSNINDKENVYNEANCVLNTGKDCVTVCNAQKDLDEDASDSEKRHAALKDKRCCNDPQRSCTWQWMDPENLSGICLPLVPPGNKFWDTDSAAQYCEDGNSEDEVIWQEPIEFADMEPVKNVELYGDESLSFKNGYCTGIGDCGAQYNYVGKWSSDGFYRTVDTASEKYFKGKDKAGQYTLKHKKILSRLDDAPLSFNKKLLDFSQLEKGLYNGYFSDADMVKFSSNFFSPFSGVGIGFTGFGGMAAGFYGITQLSLSLLAPSVSVAAAEAAAENAITEATKAIELARELEGTMLEEEARILEEESIAEAAEATKVSEAVRKTAEEAANKASTAAKFGGWMSIVEGSIATILLIVGAAIGNRQVVESAFGFGIGGAISGVIAWIGGASTLGPIGLALSAVAAIVSAFFLWAADSESRPVNFYCEPWQPPLSTNDCSKCDENPMHPCSEYKCRSLGANCKFIPENEGTNKGSCYSAEVDDVTRPAIKPWLISNHPLAVIDRRQGQLVNINNEFSVQTSSNGYKIMGKLPSFSTITFGIKTNELSQCRYTTEFDKELTYSKLTNYFSDSYYSKEHNITIAALLPDKKYAYYIVCRDPNNNPKEDEVVSAYVYKIEFETAEGPDLTPPVIETAIPPNNGVIKASGNQTLVLCVDEVSPFRCKMSRQDLDFEMMETNVSCLVKPAETQATNSLCSPLQGMCAVELNPENEGSNNYYFRCRDSPRTGNEPNTMTESYVYTITRSKPLEITSIVPQPGTEYLTRDVTIQASTSSGCCEGRAICDLKLGTTYGVLDNFITFTETNSTYHSQELVGLIKDNYTVDIYCKDDAGNEAFAQTNFTVTADLSPPNIEAVYKDSSSLHILLNEKASCEYKNTSFKFGQGTPVSTESNEAVIPLGGNKYYVACKDIFDNIMPMIEIKTDIIIGN